MIAYFLALCLIGLLAARQIKRWRDEDDLKAGEAILEQWAAKQRRDPKGRFRAANYGRFTIPQHDN